MNTKKDTLDLISRVKLDIERDKRALMEELDSLGLIDEATEICVAFCKAQTALIRAGSEVRSTK